VDGTSLVVKNPGGREVTVTTSAATKISREATGSLSAITDGAAAIVRGTGSNGTIAARNVTLGVTLNVPKPPHLPKLPKLPGGRRPPSLAVTTVEQGTSVPQIQHGNGISGLPQLGCSS
jgi:hypothetical protein